MMLFNKNKKKKKIQIVAHFGMWLLILIKSLLEIGSETVFFVDYAKLSELEL